MAKKPNIDPKSLSLVDRIVFAVIQFAWFLLPLGFGPAVQNGTRGLVFPFRLPVDYFNAADAPRWIAIALFAVYAVPAFAILEVLFAIFAQKAKGFETSSTFFSSITRIASTSVAILSKLVIFITWCDTSDYSFFLPGWSFPAFVLMVGCNALSVSRLIKSVQSRSVNYRAYLEYKKDQRVAVKTKFSEIFFRIKSKLLFSFIGLLAVVILALVTIVLVNYRSTILKAVGEGAKGQAEQASAIYKVNLGIAVNMFEYFDKQASINKNAEFKFDSFVIYTSMSDEIALDDPKAKDRRFQAEFTSAVLDSQNPPGQESLKGEKLANVINALRAKDGSLRSSAEILNKSEKTLTFVSPITTKKRLLGFTVITFKQDEILAPFIRTQASVISLTALALYLAIIFIYIIGNIIVTPLLFLRMNVRKMSDILRRMIRGEMRISSNTLVFDDVVKSRDEIKGLSGEIGELVTVIKGIIPYISASTLKYSDKGGAHSEMKDLAFLFTDIRGFTTLCEGMDPDQVVNILNRYLDLETEIIIANDGDVDKFVGDEMMAFFDGPNKNINACRAAMQIRHAMQEERERREKESLPTVHIGIGIHSGPVVFGSMGARDRMDFTSIGDTVNLAARLEGANKAYKSKSIITDTVYNQLDGHFLCRELDYIAVKGKSDPVKIYEILQEIPKAHPKLEEIRTLFESGLAEYRKRNWKKARAYFQKNVDLFNDGPSSIFLERVAAFEEAPPAKNWDGVFRMTVK